ncbi:hypothetical protein LTS14_010539 [Recurvomyces mirabilis]|uniref:uncharacterized protein n=1 Tax=Recurvomyces mirabilis TaxID=574656 RepID=UPI002DE1CA73|nr:hypothetical protein LTS14_010539 [Recurvomyces mirabilis]
MSREPSSRSSRTSSHGKLKPIAEGTELLITTTPSSGSTSISTSRTSSQEAFPTYDEPSIDTLLSYDVDLTKQRNAELAEAVARAMSISVPASESVHGEVEKVYIAVKVDRAQKGVEIEDAPLPPQESAMSVSPTTSTTTPTPNSTFDPKFQSVQLAADIAALQHSHHHLQARLDTLTSTLLAKQDSEKGLLALMRGQTQSLEEVFARLEGKGVDLKRSRSESDMSGGKPLWDERVWRGRKVAHWALLPSVELKETNEEGGRLCVVVDLEPEIEM